MLFLRFQNPPQAEIWGSEIIMENTSLFPTDLKQVYSRCLILQFSKIDSKLIKYIGEVNKFKFNKYTPGSNIKIVSEKQLKKFKPDYLLVLPWHFKDHILKREHQYLKNGGKFIFPLPDIEII